MGLPYRVLDMNHKIKKKLLRSLWVGLRVTVVVYVCGATMAHCFRNCGLLGCAAASVILCPPLSSQREGVRNSKKKRAELRLRV